MQVYCVAIIHKDNYPIWIKVFDTEADDELKFHYIAHTSLDIIEEKLLSRKNTASSSDMYLGFLFPIEVYKTYGYITNSKTKIVVITDETEVKDVDMKLLMQRIHAHYVDTVTSPFHNFDKPLTSKNFERKVRSAVTPSS